MKLKILFVALLISSFVKGQVTIASDGLNNSSSLFTVSGGVYYTGNSAAADRPATSPFAAEGTHAWGVTNGTATLLSNDINTSLYTAISATFRLAAFSIGSTTNGLDGTDVVTVEVSPDGGITWYSTIRVLGNSNAYWAYSATGTASTAYDGNVTPVDFTPAAGGSRTTDGYSTVTVTSLPAVTNLKIRITLVNNVASERWLVDDFKCQGTLACSPATNPNGSIVLASSTCGSTTLTYNGTDKATCIWQTTSLGTDTAGTPASSDITVTTSGTYYVRNYAGSCWSTADVSSTITVSKNPTVTGNPSNASIIETANTSFTVTATNPGTYQWQVSTDGGSNYNNITNGGVYSGATTATLTLTGVPLSMNGYMYKCIVFANVPCALPAVSTAATLTVAPNVNSNSDLAAVASSEAATISTTINNITIASSTDGVKVWEFYVRDGGASLNDADAYPTILNSLTITKTVGNAVTSWSDAIYSVALFDGTTFVASGSVSATQIAFTGLTVSVSDNTQKKLTLRLSLKCPLGVGAVDGDDFGFSIAKANVVFSASGSGMLSSFTTIGSANGSDVIDVTATKLAFTTQPTNTGQNNTMSSVVVKATDACGNVDTGFTGTVSLTSTGTMNAVTPIAMTAGVATFSTIVHTVIGTGYTLTATASGLTGATSTTFNITAITIFSEGDFAVVGVNSNMNPGSPAPPCTYTGPNAPYSAGDDEISFITFKDIQNGDVFYITDNGYEKASLGLWGEGEGVYQITRNGSTITAGTVITFRFLNLSPYMEFVSPDTSWTFTKATGFTGNLVMNSGGDQIFFMQGGTWNNPAGTDNATYTSGTLLYAFNTNTSWTSLANDTKNSALPLALRCFNMMPGSATDYLEYTGPTTAASKFDWIVRLNDPANWTNRGSCAAYTRMHVGQTYPVTTDTYINGVWTGAKSTDWFDCGNWQTLKVPTATTNVSVNATYATKDAVIDVVANAANAALFSNQAVCNDLTVSARKVQLEGTASNTLDVNGNLTISSTGAIDMDDSNSATTDGIIKLYGNWTNSVGNAAFAEGNGTVQFNGTGTQVISNVTPEGTETFYDVVLNNNFNTGLSNDLIASNNLILSAAKTLTVDSAGYVRVNNKLTNNGNIFIDSGGQLIQVNDGITNDGTYTGTTFQVKRTAMAKNADYIYWSSPLSSFAISSLPTNYRYIWNTTYVNTNGTQGNWNAAPGGSMAVGKGYIARASNGASSATAFPVTFSGSNPNNGVCNVTVYRGNYTGPDYDADPTVVNADTTKYDDNWNLVGNPYPSAIDAEKFLVLNQSVIDGSVWIWKHGLPPAAIDNPFYANFQENYSSTDYIKYNGLGSSEPDTFAGKIASGQGFMVSMKDVGTFVSAGATTNLDVYSSSISFKNSLRYDDTTNPYTMSHDNSDFYRTSNSATVVGNPTTAEEKHRIWLDIVNNASNQSDRMLVGYSTNSTMGRDNLYDCFFVPRGEVSLYSLIDDQSFIIQGRALPFDASDKVPLGVKIIQSGNHTIAIKKVDGMFAGGVPIYLEDRKLNIIHDLKQAPYVFTSETGIFNNRFVLRYTNETLGNHDFDSLDRNVVVSAKNGEMTINSYLENLDQVTIYDMLGRQLLEVKDIANGTLVRSGITTSSQALLVKIRLANGTLITRKIIL